MPIQNPYTLGNAWFVDKVQYVNNANEEIESLHKVMPAKVAVVDKKFAEQVKPVAVSDSLRFVKLVAYEPNDLKYEVSSEKGGVVVFSEIYYPGWQAYIDGVEAPHGRADYILRAMNVPAGNIRLSSSSTRSHCIRRKQLLLSHWDCWQWRCCCWWCYREKLFGERRDKEWAGENLSKGSCGAHLVLKKLYVMMLIIILLLY